MNEKTSFILFGVGVFVVLTFYAFFNTSINTWDGSGTINVFPKANDAKNYRLDTDNIEVSQKNIGWFRHQYSYSISNANWPDGGTLDFKLFCKIEYPNTTAECDSNSGIYQVEVHSAPEQPESDYDSGD